MYRNAEIQSMQYTATQLIVQVMRWTSHANTVKVFILHYALESRTWSSALSHMAAHVALNHVLKSLHIKQSHYNMQNKRKQKVYHTQLILPETHAVGTWPSDPFQHSCGSEEPGLALDTHNASHTKCNICHHFGEQVGG